MFNPERLSLIVQPIGEGGLRFYSYQTDDAEATVTGAGYATNAADYGLRTYDLVFVSPLDGAVDTYILAVDTIDANGHATLASPGPIGDMLKSVYDPTNVAGDAFAMDNMAEGADTKILTAAERAAIAALGTASAADLLDEDDMASNSAVDVPSQQSVKVFATAKYVATRTALKALPTAVHPATHLSESGREGVFNFVSGDFSTHITADTQEGIYVKADAIASTSGAWVRVFNNAVDAEWFGAVGDGTTDDATAIQAAIDIMSMLGGGTVRLSGADYAVGSTVSVKAGVKLIGQGGGQYPPAAFLTDADFIALPKTRLVALAGFAALTPVVQVKTEDSAKYVIDNVTLQGFMIDCAAIANYGLNVISVKHCFFRDLIIMRPTLRGVLEDCLVNSHSGTARAGAATTIQLEVTASSRSDLYNGLQIEITGGTGVGQTRTISDYAGATSQTATVSVAWGTNPDATSTYTITGVSVTEGNGAVQFNLWENINVYCGNSGSVTGWMQEGNPTNNVNQNTRINCRVVHADGNGFDLKNADTDIWINTVTYAFGSGYGCVLRGADANQTEFVRNNTWILTQWAGPGSGQGGVLAENGSGDVSKQNVMYGYSTGNGTPLPEIEDGARLQYYPDLYEYNSDPVQARQYVTRTNVYATGVFGTTIFRSKLGSGVLTEVATHEVSMAGASGSEQSTHTFKTWSSGALATQFQVNPEGVTIGSGANLKSILTATAALDYGSIAAGGVANLTVTVTGAATNDTVALGLPSNGVANGLAFKAYVSAANTVTIQAINATAAAIDPASLSFRVTVFKF